MQRKSSAELPCSGESIVLSARTATWLISDDPTGNLYACSGGYEEQGEYQTGRPPSALIYFRIPLFSGRTETSKFDKIWKGVDGKSHGWVCNKCKVQRERN